MRRVPLVDDTGEMFPEGAELTSLFPEYRVVGRLAATAMSAVYLAKETGMGDRQVVLKVLHPSLARDRSFQERFKREPLAAAQLGHPNVIPILRAEERAGVCVLAMPFVPGPNLSRLIASVGRLDPAQTVNIVGQVASALDAARRHNLVHRDVKPSNILLERHSWLGWHPYLCDFGIAKLTDRTGVTGKHQVLGTALYMAPEQCVGQSLDHRADQYALGCVVFECLTGEPPYPRSDDRAIAQAHLNAPVPAVTEHQPDLPSELDAVVARALAKDPAERYPSSGAFAEALERAASSGRLEVTGAPPHSRLPVRWNRRLPVSADHDATVPMLAAGGRRRRWRMPLVVAAAAIAVLVATAAMVWPDATPFARPQPSAELLARLPAGLRDHCEVAEQPAAPGAAESLTCTDASGQVASFGFFADGPATAAAYAKVVRGSGVKPGGDCGLATGGEHRYPATGTPKGRVVCHARGPVTVLSWTDTARRTVATAESTAGGAGLVDAWNTWVGTSPFPTAVEQQLLDSAGIPDCGRAPVTTFDDFPAAEAGIECRVNKPGVLTVSAYRVARSDQLRRSYADHAAAVRAPAGVDCVGKPKGFLGDDRNTLYELDMGGLLCYRNSEGRYVLEWTWEPLRLQARAVGSDAAKLLAWWADVGPSRAQLAKLMATLAEPAYPTARESGLLARIPAASRVNCLRPPAVTTKELIPGHPVTMLMCGPTRGAKRVYYAQFADVRALRDDHGPVDPSLGDCTRNPPGFKGEVKYRNGRVGGWLLSWHQAARPSSDSWCRMCW